MPLRLHFALLLAAAAFAADDVFPRADRIVAVGDLHGDYAQAVSVLRSAGVLDAGEHWSGGNTHLVQTGDVLDRGPDGFKIIDLLMRLEKEARRKGGRVHALIGNHEAMNLYGDLRYVSPEEAARFEKPEERQALLGPEGKYGQWIRSRNAVVKVGRSIFLHGGIGPNYGELSIREINERVREELNDFSKLPNGAVMDTEGPLWFRGLLAGNEEPLIAHVNAVLQRNGADRIVVGHSIMPRITARFGGKVIGIDVGISRVYNGGRIACLVIEREKPYALEAGQRAELSTGGK
jgi:hypothetical protein